MAPFLIRLPSVSATVTVDAFETVGVRAFVGPTPVGTTGVARRRQVLAASLKKEMVGTAPGPRLMGARGHAAPARAATKPLGIATVGTRAPAKGLARQKA